MEFSGLLVGALLAACLIIIGGAAAFSLHLHGWGAPEYSLHCIFEKGLGLRVGTRVQVNGVDVGRVSAIELTESGQVALTLAIKKVIDGKQNNPHITTESIINATRDQNLISERTINIGKGSGRGRILQEGDTLWAGDAQDIETVLEKANELLDRIAKIATATDTLLRMTRDPNSTVGALIGSRELYDNINEKIETLGDIGNQGNALLASVNRTLPGLLERTDTLTTGVVGVVEDLQVLAKKAGNIMETLDTTVYSLNLMMGDLQQVASNANNLMVDGEEKLQRVDDLVTGISKFWFIRNKIPAKDSITAIGAEVW